MSRRGAVRLMERIYEARTGESAKGLPLEALADRWVVLPRRRRLNPRYIAMGRSLIGRFAAFIQTEYSGVKDMTRVTTTMAEDFMSAEAKRGITAQTWNDKLILLMCTAMRRGDCCLLKWADVDLRGRFLTVKTAKTGQTVAIPIFPMLYDALLNQPRTASPFVFPEAAALYQRHPMGITRRVQRVLAAAGFHDAQDGDAPARGETHAERKDGLRRASIRDFRSFRVTWVTLALTAGVPLELVQKVTGHKTTDIVLKHYFQPGCEAFRDTLHKAMPRLLSNGEKSAKEKLREAVETVRMAKQDRARLLELIAAL